MTPPKHVNFHAKKLFGEMGRIVDVVTLVKTLDVCRLVHHDDVLVHRQDGKPGGGVLYAACRWKVIPLRQAVCAEGNFLTPEAKKFTGPEQYPWLVRKIVSLLFMKKVNKGFEDFAKSWGCTRPLDDKPVRYQCH